MSIIETAMDINRAYEHDQKVATIVPSSPLPVQEDKYSGEIDFYEALREVVGGGKVTKLEWEDSSEYVFMKDERLSIHKDSVDFNFTVREPDILGEDWVVLND